MTGIIASVESVDGYVVAALQGEIDVANAPDVEEELLEALPADAPGLILELDQVEYADSAGVRMLFAIARKLEGRHQSFGLAVPEHAPIRTLLRVTGVHEAMAVRDDTRAAIDALSMAGELAAE